MSEKLDAGLDIYTTYQAGLLLARLEYRWYDPRRYLKIRKARRRYDEEIAATNSCPVCNDRIGWFGIDSWCVYHALKPLKEGKMGVIG